MGYTRAAAPRRLDVSCLTGMKLMLKPSVSLWIGDRLDECQLLGHHPRPFTGTAMNHVF